MKKKVWIGLLVVLTTLFTACGGAKDEGAVIISYYGRPNEKGFETKVIKAFEKENPEIKVNYVELAENTDQKLKTINTVLQARDSSMDVFVGDVTWTSIFVGAGWVMDIDLSEEEIASFTPGSIEAFKSNEKIYGIPFFTDGGLLYYRSDLLEKYNKEVPQTWEDLVDISMEIMEKEKNPNLYGFAGSWRQFEGLTTNLAEVVWSHGGDFLDKDGKVVFNSKESVKAMKLIGDMNNKFKITPPGITNFGSADLRSLFLNEQLIFSRDWPTFAKMMDDSNVTELAGKIKFTTLPHDRGQNSYSTLGGWGVMVSKFSKHPEAAIKFAKFRASKEIQKQEAIELSHLPAIVSLYEDEDVMKAMPYAKEMLPIMMATNPRPKTPYYAKVSAILQQQTQDVLNKEKTAEEAVKMAHDAIKKTIGER